jgi:hypothetical protein
MLTVLGPIEAWEIILWKAQEDSNLCVSGVQTCANLGDSMQETQISSVNETKVSSIGLPASTYV